MADCYLYPKDFDCILVDKVFDSCLKKVCFEEVDVTIPAGVDSTATVEVIFANGVIKPGSLNVIESALLPADCKRVKLTVVFEIIVRFTQGNTVVDVPVTLPDVPLDIVLFYPDTRSEFKFDIILETRGELLDEFVIQGTPPKVGLSIGEFIITKVLGKVQLKLNNVYPYCVPPRECRDFSSNNPCVDFETAPFPGDFYPPQPAYIDSCCRRTNT